MENLTDRQAAQMVALRMDWKYALSLAPEDEGFDYSVLSQFRQRLIEQGAEDLVLEPLLAVCREHGWLKGGGKQRTDSTHVLAAVRTLSSLESVGEALRAALNVLAESEPEWLLEHIEDDWFDRYVHLYWLLGSSVQKRGTLRGRKICFPCLQTQAGWCRIRRRQQQTHA
jgi:transposase